VKWRDKKELFSDLAGGVALFLILYGLLLLPLLF